MTRDTLQRAPGELAMYRRHALRHFTQAFVIVIPVALALFTESLLLPLLLMLAGEALVLGVLPHIPAFRRGVQESVARAARVALLDERAQLVPGMAAEHRNELEALETLVSTIRVRTGCGVEREDWLGVENLLTLYIRLAVAHRRSAEALSSESASELGRQLARVERARAVATTELSRARVDQHLTVLRRRCALRAHAEEQRAATACELGTIADLVRCLYDECMSVDGASVSSDVQEAISEALRGAAVLGELARLHSADSPVDVPCSDAAFEAPESGMTEDRGGREEGASCDPAFTMAGRLATCVA